MKRLILSLGIVLTALFAASCSNDDVGNADIKNYEISKTESEQEKALVELQEKISRISQEWMLKAPAVETRGPARWKTVGKADMIGARIGKYAGVWGAVIVGAAASAFAIYITRPKSVVFVPTTDIYEKATIIQLDEDGNPCPIDSVGYYHNKLLVDIGIDKIVAADYDEIESLIVDGANKLGLTGQDKVQVSLLRNNADLQFLKNNMVQLNNTANATEYCNILKNNLKTVSDAEIRVLGEYMAGLDAIDTSRHQQYTQATINAIWQSALPFNTKNGLSSSIIVGNASTKLWAAVY